VNKYGTWAVKEVTAPSVEPITLAEAREQLRLDAYGSPPAHPLDDQIEGEIIAARNWIEQYLGFAIIQRTLRLYLDEFPASDVIELPRSNLISISSVKYYDRDGVQQTWAASNYSADTASFVGRLIRDADVNWPTTQGKRQAVEIEYVAGYENDGASPPDLRANVPGQISKAMRLMVQHYHEGGLIDKSDTTLQDRAESLLHPIRRVLL